MPKRVLQTSGYKSLGLYSHVYATGTEDLPADTNYGAVLQRDIRETQNDQAWIRNDLNQILVANELLKHKLQFVQTDGQRMKQLEMERERREQEERKDWSERVQIFQREDDERERLQQEWEKIKAGDLRRMAEVRRQVEEERRQVAASQRRIDELVAFQSRPPRGRFPRPGYLVLVYVMYADGLPVSPGYSVAAGFDRGGGEAVRSRAFSGEGQPVWNEYLAPLHMPEGAQHLKLELLNGKDEVGHALLDLRTAENEVTWVEVRHREDVKGRLYLLFNCQMPYPPPPPPMHLSGSTLDLQVIQGRDLLDRDVLGKGDPYVQLCWGSEAKPFFTTKVAKGRNPVWNEGVSHLPVPMGVDSVALTVFDKDLLGHDDFLGHHKIGLRPAPKGHLWVLLGARDGNAADAKLLQKHNNRLGELYLNVAFHEGEALALQGPQGTGTCPTRCLVTVTSVDGLQTLEDPFVTVNVGDNEATSGHRINPLWNPTFEVFAPEDESFMNFRVFEDALLNRDGFLGQANFDIRPTLRTNQTYTLPLLPRSSQGFQSQNYRNDGSGRIHFHTEWLGAAAGPGTQLAIPIRPAAASGSDPYGYPGSASTSGSVTSHRNSSSGTPATLGYP